jgi:hypothetical protein
MPGAAPAPPGDAASRLTVKYTAPDRIPLKVPTDFRLIIYSAAQQQSGDFSGAPGNMVTATVPRVTHVIAKMISPPGLVDVSTAGTQACQTVGPEDNPSWDWYVTPQTTQAFNLWIELWDAGPDCNTPAPAVHRLDTFRINVSTTPWQWLIYEAPFWQKALLGLFAVITAGGGAFGAWSTLRRRTKS